MPFDILPFGDPMIPEAGALLALRHERLRASRPESPARFEEPEAARAAVEALWRRERAGGVAARGEDGRMRGYLIGDLVLDNLWGEAHGCASPDALWRPIRMWNWSATCMRRSPPRGSRRAASRTSP
jgi:hypothetical protein